uniref:pre-mRNA-processing factor 39-like n=1 Tax=Styela clava TaxID=7725 RepID=UPI001939475C|nr:pre-mRNA-processing factor 39-like [Styela clava]
MPKRRKSRQSKKAASVEEEAPVEEIQDEESRDSSLQEEESSGEVANKDSIEDIDKNQTENKDSSADEKIKDNSSPNIVGEMSEGTTKQDKVEEIEPMETTPEETTAPADKKSNETTAIDNSATDKVDTDNDAVETPTEPPSGNVNIEQTVKPSTTESDVVPNPSDVANLNMEVDKSQSEENLNQIDNEDDKKNQETNEKTETEEEGIPTGPTVEKIPTSPLCYDDEKDEIPIDPEGDEGEVVIGSESAEFLKYWRAVLENPQDFTNWTYLLQLVEQENKSPLARRAYNGFFKRYPLCYGYWKKFSEMEKRHGNYVRAQRILERGVRAIPLSIDLWVHMIDFYTTNYKGPDAGKEKVKIIFERAVKAAGPEFRSEKLWNKYIHWEQSNKDWNAVIDIYDRVLKLPTQHYAIFFKDYKEFVMSRSPKEILSYQEFEEMLEEVRDDADALEKDKKKDAEDQEMQEDVDDDAPPGVESNDRGKPPNEKELKAVSEKIIEKKKKMFDETEASVTKIWTFEEGIKRPYFHVKALERTQIKNWRDYLEAEIGRQDNAERVVLLFERCLIACALYEDFWLKYARYLMKSDSSRARDVYRRACQIHLPKKPNIHLHWATFEELEGHHDVAAKILEDLEKTLPNLAMVKLRRVAIERRAGNIQAAEDIMKGYVSAAEKGTDECFYIRKYVWFLVKVSNKIDEARQVLKDAIQANADKLQLYKDLVGLEFSHGSEDQVIAACDLALESSLSDEVKFQFSQRRLEYLEDFGTDAKRMQKAYDDHQKLYRSHKKRVQSVSETSAVQPVAKKSKTEVTSPVSGGNKIMTTASRGQYSAKPTTNGTYSTNQVTVSAQPQSATTIQSTQQVYPQVAAASGDPSLYYQNYWNYQQKPEVQQYNYSQWPQYSQQYYQQ